MLTPLAVCTRMDDCIPYRKIESAHDVIMLQNDLCLLEQWEKWKCLLMLTSAWFFQLHKKEFLYKENIFCTILNIKYILNIWEWKLTPSYHSTNI